MKTFFGLSRGLAGGHAFGLLARVPTAGVAVFAGAVILLLGAPAAYAASSTFYVNAATGTDSSGCGASSSPCQSISYAVSLATDGDTIQVAAGTYDESFSTDKSLKLVGAQSGNPGSAARAPESPATESVVTGSVTIEADGVTVDGFSFSSPGAQVDLSGASNATVENNEFSGYSAALDVTDATATRIIGNYFTSNPQLGSTGVSFDGGCDGTFVTDNTFYAAANDGGGDIHFSCDNTGDPSSVITVSGNHANQVGDTAAESFVVFLDTAENVDITDNALTNSTGASTIYFNDDSDIGAVDVSGNTVTGTNSAGVTILSAGGGSAFTITGNRLSAGKYGIYAANGVVASGATVTARGNDVSGNSSAGVRGDSSTSAVGQVDADDNWWGCNAGPSQPGCSPSTGAVKRDTWLVLGISASPSTVIAPGSSTVTADVTQNNNGDDTSAEGTIPDGTTIAFATDFGTLSAPTAATTAGRASVTLSSSLPGTANVSAALDSQTVSTTVTFTMPPRPTTADQCMKGGWQSYGIFKNQGDCVSFVATHGKNPPGK
jgi:parallel beta-helix repeat protein